MQGLCNYPDLIKCVARQLHAHADRLALALVCKVFCKHVQVFDPEVLRFHVVDDPYGKLQWHGRYTYTQRATSIEHYRIRFMPAVSSHSHIGHDRSCDDPDAKQCYANYYPEANHWGILYNFQRGITEGKRNGNVTEVTLHRLDGQSPYVCIQMAECDLICIRAEIELLVSEYIKWWDVHRETLVNKRAKLN